jgi:hypothetical protein
MPSSLQFALIYQELLRERVRGFGQVYISHNWLPDRSYREPCYSSNPRLDYNDRPISIVKEYSPIRRHQKST